MVLILFERLGPYHMARLEAAGKRMELVCLEELTADETYAWDVIEGAQQFQRIRLFTAAENPASTPKAEIVRRVTAALDKADPEVVAVPGWATPLALAALRWCLAHRRPAIVMSETTRMDASRQFFKEAIKRRIVSLFSAGLAGGKPHQEYLIELGLAQERVFTGYDAVDNAYFETQAGRVHAAEKEPRTKLGLPKQYFLASNRFIEKKNLSALLTAYAAYRRQAGEGAWSLVLLGDGPLMEKMLQQRAELGLESEVHLPGFKQYKELPAYYALAGGFIHASTTEQWGLVVNEAMASGLPVLVSDRCGCATDLVTEGIQGWTFDPFDLPSITNALIRLAALPEDQRALMGNAARERIADLSPDAFGEGLLRAVEAARTAPPRNLTLVDRLLLESMLRR